MSGSPVRRVTLTDPPNQKERNTQNLIASLRVRLTSLHYVSGAKATGSIIAGFAALGREYSRTTVGSRMREALNASRAGTNARIIWKNLRIEEWASQHPPCPILDQLRNDVALLLADDLEECLSKPISPIQPLEYVKAPDEVSVNPIDYILGLWVYSKEFCWAIQKLIPSQLLSKPYQTIASQKIPPLEGSLTR
ncbi:MAG: hypothetical protein ACFFB3_12360 [Candidatus Hodarchaeota archaeon]